MFAIQYYITVWIHLQVKSNSQTVFFVVFLVSCLELKINSCLSNCFTTWEEEDGSSAGGRGDKREKEWDRDKAERGGQRKEAGNPYVPAF